MNHSVYSFIQSYKYIPDSQNKHGVDTQNVAEDVTNIFHFSYLFGLETQLMILVPFLLPTGFTAKSNECEETDIFSSQIQFTSLLQCITHQTFSHQKQANACSKFCWSCKGFFRTYQQQRLFFYKKDMQVCLFVFVQGVFVCLDFCSYITLPGHAVMTEGHSDLWSSKCGLSLPVMEFLPSKKFSQTVSIITAPFQTTSCTKWITRDHIERNGITVVLKTSNVFYSPVLAL